MAKSARQFASVGSRVFISWSPSCTRSSTQAKHFGANLVKVSYLRDRKSFAVLLIRYMISFGLTLRILYRERPSVIFAENQPPFLIAAVYLHTKLFGGIYILDSHSGAFNNRKWAWALPAYRFFAVRAFLNINTNEYHKEMVESWGGRSVVISDIPIDHAQTYPHSEVSKNSIAVVASFAFDEPLQEIWKAANLTPDVDYYVTGNEKKLQPELIESKPINMHLVGFLPLDRYWGLLSSVKGIMVLTTRDNTMQRGAYEALSLEQPIITSDWQVLRNSFGKSAIYVKNEASSIAGAVNQLLEDQESYKRAAIYQRKIRRECFEAIRDAILEEISDRHKV